MLCEEIEIARAKCCKDFCDRAPVSGGREQKASINVSSAYSLVGTRDHHIERLCQGMRFNQLPSAAAHRQRPIKKEGNVATDFGPQFC
jgi:hypothetical protein